MMTYRFLKGLFIVAAIAGCSAAHAQTPPAQPAPPPVPSVPQSTSATFGDWALNCQRVTEGTNQRKICEITQTLSARGQNAPVARIAVGRLATNEPLRLTVVLPVNITPGTTPRLLVGDKAVGAINLGWQRCLPGGCFAAAPLEEASLKLLRATAEQSRIVFHDAADREAAIPMSQRGLAQALDALAKEDASK